MSRFDYIASLPQDTNEDLVQQAWLDALEKLEERPNAKTAEELKEKYEHVAGLVTTIYKRRRIDGFRKKKEIQLEEQLAPPVYDRYNIFDDDLSDLEKEAILYYLDLCNRDEPMSSAEKVKLSRYRKATGLVLKMERKRFGREDD